MQKLDDLQKMIDLQREKKSEILRIFETVFGKKIGIIKMDIEFGLNNIIKIKIKDKSSIKFIVLKSKEKIIEEYNKKFPEDMVLLS